MCTKDFLVLLNHFVCWKRKEHCCPKVYPIWKLNPFLLEMKSFKVNGRKACVLTVSMWLKVDDI